MSGTRLHIVVSCTDRKRHDAAHLVRASALRGSSVASRVREWTGKLRNALGPRVRAADLYAGDHWSVARQLPEAASAVGYAPTLWVASAGYGLVAMDDLLIPYSATFTANQADYVGRVSEGGISDWWDALVARSLVTHDKKRSLRSIATDDPKAIMLVAASPTYLAALQADLRAAAASLVDPERLVVVSSKNVRLPQGVPDPVLADKRLQANLGGSLTSIHARVAQLVLESVPKGSLRASEARIAVAQMVANAPKVRPMNRAVASDQEIMRFITSKLKQDLSATHSRMLREYRDAGRACEQSRFRRLFETVVR